MKKEKMFMKKLVSEQGQVVIPASEQFANENGIVTAPATPEDAPEAATAPAEPQDRTGDDKVEWELEALENFISLNEDIERGR